MKKKISELVGTVISHTKYGDCEVIEVTDVEKCKFRSRIIETGEIKQFVFSTQFFNVEGDYETTKIQLPKKIDHSRPHKPVDYNKYRNHPLVKEIDRKEAGIRYRTVVPVSDNEDEEESLEG